MHFYGLSSRNFERSKCLLNFYACHIFLFFCRLKLMIQNTSRKCYAVEVLILRWRWAEVLEWHFLKAPTHERYISALFMRRWKIVLKKHIKNYTHLGSDFFCTDNTLFLQKNLMYHKNCIFGKMYAFFC